MPQAPLLHEAPEEQGQGTHNPGQGMLWHSWFVDTRASRICPLHPKPSGELGELPGVENCTEQNPAKNTGSSSELPSTTGRGDHAVTWMAALARGGSGITPQVLHHHVLGWTGPGAPQCSSLTGGALTSIMSMRL